MAFRDLRKYLAAIEEMGQLVRVKKEIESGHEVFGLVWELNDGGGPAVVLESIKGHSMPIVANLFGSLERYALGCGFPRGLTLMQYRDLFVQALDRSKWQSPRLVPTGPCKEVILRGDDVDLTKIPILQWHPLDGGPYITATSVITRDSKLGLNIGMYRMMVHDKNTTGLMCNVFQDIGSHIQKAKRAGRDRLECAVAIGNDP